MTTAAVRNEQTKLLASAVSNLGIATIAAGVIAPVVGFYVGTLDVDDPLRLASFVVICLAAGGALLRLARLILEDLV